MQEPDRFAPPLAPVADVPTWSAADVARLARRARVATWIVRLVAAAVTVTAWRDVVLAFELCAASAMMPLAFFALVLAWGLAPVAALLVSARRCKMTVGVATAGVLFATAASSMMPRGLPGPAEALLSFRAACLLWIVVCMGCMFVALANAFARRAAAVTAREPSP